MKWVLYVISLIWVGSGVWFILYTEQSRNILTKAVNKAYDFLWALLAAIIGVLLIMAAPESRNMWFIVLLGILAAIKGLVIFFNPRNTYQRIKHWYLYDASDQMYRFFGIIILVLGIAVFSWI
jgi:uncharacterized protein YjeT (DUF2065 family)